MKVQQDRDILALLPDLGPEAFATLRAKLRSERCQERFPYAVIGGVNIQLDGHHRRRICNQDGIAYDWRLIETVTTKAEAISWVKCNQIGRRNLGEDDLERLRGERRERVAEARSEGHSTRVIADAEGISASQVRRDLEAAEAPGAPRGAPGHTNGKIKGKDGKNYTAGKPKGPKKPKPEGFDLKGWESHLGYVIRGVDDLTALAKQVQPKLAEKLAATLGDIEYLHDCVKVAAKATKGVKA